MLGGISRQLRLLALCSAALCGPILAAGPPVVDVVALKSGRPLRGAVLARQPDGTVLMAVSREWLEQTDPKEFARQSQQSDDEQRTAWSNVKDRIEALLAEEPESQRLRFFLKQERDRLAKLMDDEGGADPPAFLLREIPGNRVGKVQPAAPQHQRLAMFAWKQRLLKVESRSAADLQQELEAAGVDLDEPVPDLSDMLPSRKQSDDEWSARLAIVCYALDDGLDFQGVDDTLVRTGEGREMQLAAILPKLLTRDVDALLGDLLGPGGKPQANKKVTRNYSSAINIANDAGQRGFRVTRLDVNVERLTVSVQTEFVVGFAEDDWQPIWQHVETADGTKVRKGDEQRIAKDPQVKAALESMKALGLAADDAVTQAIRVGAATMSAQQNADARFFEFRDRYLKRLDGPILPVRR